MATRVKLISPDRVIHVKIGLSRHPIHILFFLRIIPKNWMGQITSVVIREVEQQMVLGVTQMIHLSDGNIAIYQCVVSESFHEIAS